MLHNKERLSCEKLFWADVLFDFGFQQKLLDHQTNLRLLQPFPVPRVQVVSLGVLRAKPEANGVDLPPEASKSRPSIMSAARERARAKRDAPVWPGEGCMRRLDQ